MKDSYQDDNSLDLIMTDEDTECQRLQDSTDEMGGAPCKTVTILPAEFYLEHDEGCIANSGTLELDQGSEDPSG